MVRAKKKTSDPLQKSTIPELRAEMARRGMVLPAKGTKKDSLIRLLKENHTQVKMNTRRSASKSPTSTTVTFDDELQVDDQDMIVTEDDDTNPPREMNDVSSPLTGHEERMRRMEHTIFNMASKMEELYQQKTTDRPACGDRTPEDASGNNSLSNSNSGAVSSFIGHSGPSSMNNPVGTYIPGQNGLPRGNGVPNADFSLSHSNYGDVSSVFEQSGPSSTNNPVGTFHPGQNSFNCESGGPMRVCYSNKD